MKKNSPISQKNHDHDPALEDDTLWETLAKSPSRNAPANFAQNTMRAARLSQESTRASWRNLLIKPTLAFGGAIAVIAIGAFVLFEPGNDNSPAEVASTTGNNESDWLNEALISTAIEKPDLFTDAEIVAMIF